MLVTAAITGYHWYSSASFESALRMMTEDYRLAAACPTEMEAVLSFVHRSPSPDGYSPMSVRYGDDWIMQVCNGDIANDQSTDLAKVAQPTQVGAPVATGVPMPSTEATVGAKIQSTVEAPVRPSVEVSAELRSCDMLRRSTLIRLLPLVVAPLLMAYDCGGFPRVCLHSLWKL